MITQTYDLNLIPEYATVPLIVKMSQYDNISRTFVFQLWDGDVSFTPPSGVSAYIEGTKPDAHGFSYPATISGSTVRVDCRRQMAAVPGETRCEIKLVNNTTGEVLGTTNFVLYVEAAGLNDDTDVSETELPQLITLATEQMNQARQSAQEAAASATSAGSSATSATSSATSAANSAASAEASATSAGNSATSAAQSASQAAQYSVNVPYIGANGNWWVWNTTDGEYIDTGVDASITVNIADITMLDANATPYVINSGTSTDPVFHLFIPRGKGITSIVKTATSGLNDTYTITYSDGTTTTFIVTNGKTAYQSAVEAGYEGTEAEFYDDLAEFKDWKDDAGVSANAAAASATSASNSATSAQQSKIDAKNDADRAQMYADFLEPSFIIANNRLYIKNDAVGEFIVAHNRLYMKLVAA